MLLRILDALLNRYPALFNLMRTRVSGDFTPLAGELAGRPGWTVLDLACGTAFYAPALWGDRGVRYVGVDRTAQYLDVALKNYPPGRFVLGDAFRLPFRGGSFDLAASIGFLHHIPDAGMDAVLAEVRRVLKPGGLFVVAEPVLFFRFLRYFLVPRRVMVRLDRGQYVREPERYHPLLGGAFDLEREFPFRNGPHDWWAMVWKKWF